MPLDLGRRLFDATPQPKTLWIAPEGGHNDLFAHRAPKVVLDSSAERAWKPPYLTSSEATSTRLRHPQFAE